ncbi:MAG: hypothetical protein WA642_11345 [Steroidobacteraceae bacterium]
MNDCLSLVIVSGLLINAMALANAQDVAPPAIPASACIHDPPISIPKNKLLNFNSPNRVPNAYLVGFKCDKTLDTANTAAHRSQVLPNTLPTSPANCAALASAYAVRFGGNVGGVWCNSFGFRGFSITGISEAAISDLAQDDRVEYVEPDEFASTS